MTSLPTFSPAELCGTGRSSELEVAIRLRVESSLAGGEWSAYQGAATEELRDSLAAQWPGFTPFLCSSGTIGVELALRGVGAGPDKAVVLAGYDFPGNFRAVEACGAWPVVADVQADGWSLAAEGVKQAVWAAARGDIPPLAAILASHLHGTAAELPEISSIAQGEDIALVEDICQAPAGCLRSRRLGSWGDAAVLSFGGSKLLSAGRGGAVLFRQPRAVQRAKVFAERGNSAFPLSELQAAALLPQLEFLPVETEIREQAVEELVADIAGELQLSGATADSNSNSGGHLPRDFYKLAWQPAEEMRDRLVAAAAASHVPLGEGFRGFVTRGRNRCTRLGDLPHSSKAARRTVVLHHTALRAALDVRQRLARWLVTANRG